MSGFEQEIIINPGEWQLPGVLTLPDGEGPFPIVVFVHGSGGNDRDETVGKQKLFRDLASYLQKEGVASLRYDKRTYIYGAKMVTDYSLTVKEETIDDAISAVRLAKTFDAIDPARIFIAGHSMGGYLVPRLDAADPVNIVAGYISLAGAVRSIMELTLEQIDYILSITPSMSDADKEAQKKALADIDQAIKGLTDADRGSSKAYMGAYASYWLDLADYKPDKEVLKVKEPMLFLQGGHDYQVTEVDFELWEAALKDNPRARFILYPELTHTFTRTDAKSAPNDYNTYARVDEQVARDIKRFIFEC